METPVEKLILVSKLFLISDTKQPWKDEACKCINSNYSFLLMVNEQCEFNVGGLEKGKMEGKCLENGLENV